MGLEAVIFGLTAAIAWGVADFVGARAAKKFGGITAVFFVTLIGTLLYSAVYLLFLREHSAFNKTAAIYAVASGVSYTLAMAAFFKGLEHGPVSIVSPLGSTYPLVATLVLVLIFGASLSLQQGFGIALVIGGVVVAAGLLDKGGKEKRGISKGPMLGIVASIFWGCTIALAAQAMELVGWQQTTLIESVACTLTFIAILPLVRGKENIFGSVRATLSNKFLLASSVLQLTGLLALNTGVDKVADLAPIAIAVSAVYPAITVFLALKHLNESVKLLHLAGALVAVAGIVILSLG